MPGGVVVFDDIITAHTPGVTAAVWQGATSDGLVPLCQTWKLYGTWDKALGIKIRKHCSPIHTGSWDTRC